MAENTKIEWCDHTINWWWGCTKVSPACDHCYAERQDAHFHPDIPWQSRFQGEKATASHWGPDAPRLVRVEAARREALRYERRAVAENRRFRVFTNSMADFFEDRRDLDSARLEALDVMRMTPHLAWLVLTKRPERILECLGRAQKLAQAGGLWTLVEWLGRWLNGEPPANVWLGTTVEDQARANQRIPALLQVPAALQFLSMEPLLGAVDLQQILLKQSDRPETGKPDVTIDALKGWHGGAGEARARIHWVICGGESGHNARPMHPDWIRSLRDQCAAAGFTPFFFKGWGKWGPCKPPVELVDGKDVWIEKERPRSGIYGRLAFPCSPIHWVKRGHNLGHILDGVEYNEFPVVRP
jgi:protein gp37